MAGARQAQTRAQPPQIDPAQLSADGPPQALGYPGGDRAPIPAAGLRSGSMQCGMQLFRVRCGQQLSMWPGQTPLVFDTLRSTGIVAARDLANPVHTESCAVLRCCVRSLVKRQPPGLAPLAGGP